MTIEETSQPAACVGANNNPPRNPHDRTPIKKIHTKSRSQPTRPRPPTSNKHPTQLPPPSKRPITPPPVQPPRQTPTQPPSSHRTQPSRQLTNSPRKIPPYALANAKIPPRKFRIPIPITLQPYTRKICEMLVYKHTETIEQVKK